ncbi:MAG: transrane sensor, partial [Bacteroidota bacterium]|nr:transrane sensor [Bacteroidota bacterium]
GQSVTFENGKQSNNPTNAVKPDWTTNQMTFNKETLKSLLSEVERQYNVEIELNSESETSLFTGKLPVKDLDVALQIISTTYHLEAKKVSKNKIIFDEK